MKYAKAAGLHHRSLTPLVKVIQLFSFLSLGATLFCMMQLSWAVIAITGLFGVLTMFYAVPFPKRNLRSFPSLKLLIVGLVWAGVSVLVPVASIEANFTSSDVITALSAPSIWLLFLQRVLLVMVLTLPFEIRDLPFDSPQLRTLPQLVGMKKTVGIGIALLTVVLLLEGLKDVPRILDSENVPSIAIISLFIICVLTGILLVKSQKKQSKYFASFIVESIPIVWVFLYVGLAKLL